MWPVGTLPCKGVAGTIIGRSFSVHSVSPFLLVAFTGPARQLPSKKGSHDFSPIKINCK